MPSKLSDKLLSFLQKMAIFHNLATVQSMPAMHEDSPADPACKSDGPRGVPGHAAGLCISEPRS